MRLRLILPMMLLLAGCSLAMNSPPPLLLQGKVVLTTDTLWQGEIVIDGEVTVAHGVTLELAPGTRVQFVRRDADRDGLGDATIIVKGSLVATGTEEKPILFSSAEVNPKAGDWLEIRSDFARQLTFDWCEFRDSAYTLHAHFTRGHLRNSYIHHNIDGSRLGRSRFALQNNLIENNSGKGINFRDSEITLTDNIIRNNRVGIFLFEKPGNSLIRRNNIYQNELNLQLGDFFADDVAVQDNWWGGSDLSRIRQSIYDQQDDSELGRVTLAPKSEWLFTAGIKHRSQLVLRWTQPTSGFVDSTPAATDSGLYFASWDGQLRAVDKQGRLLWQAETGDVIDAPLLQADGQIFVQNWSRQVYAINSKNGQSRLFFEYPSSPADDHRQAGLVQTDTLLLLPAWNGTLYAFERKTLRLRWQYDAQLPLRAAPLVKEGQIYQPSGSGTLSVLDSRGQLLWQRTFAAPLLSTPVSLPSGGVALLDKSGTLVALDAKGVVLWQRELGQACFYAAPVVADAGLVVVTAAGYLWKFDPRNGQTIWVRKLGQAIYATPANSAAGILVGNNDGTLYLIDAVTGRTLDEYKAAGAIQSQVLVTGNRLYFGSRDRNLHALQLIQGGLTE